MSTQNPSDPKTAEQNDNSTEKLEDLQQREETDEDAREVKGGDMLNPQPLPPRHIPIY